MKENALAFLDRLCVVLGALTFSQVPTFVQQYVQQLQGRVEELRLQVGLMTHSAERSGKTLNELVHKFLASQDTDVVQQGEIIQEMLKRLTRLSEALEALTQSSAFTKFFVFLKHLHYDVFKSTLSHFLPALTFSIEGLVYVLLGALIGFATFVGIKKLLGLTPISTKAP